MNDEPYSDTYRIGAQVWDNILGRNGSSGVAAHKTYRLDAVESYGYHVYEECRVSPNYPRGRCTLVFTDNLDAAKYILSIIELRQNEIRTAFTDAARQAGRVYER